MPRSKSPSSRTNSNSSTGTGATGSTNSISIDTRTLSTSTKSTSTESRRLPSNDIWEYAHLRSDSQFFSKDNKGGPASFASPRDVGGRLPYLEVIKKSAKELLVIPKIWVQMINDVNSTEQTFKGRLFICGTDSPLNQVSSTVAFQYNMRHIKEKSELKPNKYPPWQISILNTKEYTDTYKTKQLPSVVHVESYENNNNQIISEHFYERQNISGEFASDFYLQSFPFDRQLLKIEISLDCPMYIATFDQQWLAANRRYDKDNIIVDDTVKVDSAFKSVLESSEWSLDIQDIFYSLRKYEKQRANCNSPADDDDKRSSLSIDNCTQYSRLTIAIPVTRKFNHYFSIIIFPLILLNFATILAFDLSRNNMELLSAILLAVFSLKLSFASMIPKLSYNSTIDKLFLLSYIYIFMCMVLAYVFRVDESKEKDAENNKAFIENPVFLIIRGIYMDIDKLISEYPMLQDIISCLPLSLFKVIRYCWRETVTHKLLHEKEFGLDPDIIKKTLSASGMTQFFIWIAWFFWCFIIPALGVYFKVSINNVLGSPWYKIIVCVTTVIVFFPLLTYMISPMKPLVMSVLTFIRQNLVKNPRLSVFERKIVTQWLRWKQWWDRVYLKCYAIYESNITFMYLGQSFLDAFNCYSVFMICYYWIWEFIRYIFCSMDAKEQCQQCQQSQQVSKAPICEALDSLSSKLFSNSTYASHTAHTSCAVNAIYIANATNASFVADATNASVVANTFHLVDATNATYTANTTSSHFDPSTASASLQNGFFLAYKCLFVVLLLSIYHIAMDCYENIRKFEDELHAYKEKARKALDDLAKPKPSTYHIFLSHGGLDNKKRAVLRQVKKYFTNLGYDVFYFEDRILPSIYEVVEHSVIVLACISKDIEGTNVCIQELDNALNAKEMGKEQVITLSMDPEPSSWAKEIKTGNESFPNLWDLCNIGVQDEKLVDIGEICALSGWDNEDEVSIPKANVDRLHKKLEKLLNLLSKNDKFKKLPRNN